MKYGLLQFDAKLSLAGLRDSNTVIQPELKNQAPPVVPATESEADTEPKLGSQTPEDVAVEELNVALERLWVLSEREHRRHEISCPALLARAVQSLDGIAPPGAKLNVLREPKNGTSGVPADPVHNSVVRENRTRPDAALPMRGLTASPKWYSPKLDGPELNRAHKDQYIHYEASAIGMEEADSEEPRYRGSEHSPPSPSESLHNRDDVRNGEKDSSAELDSEGSPTLVGDPDLIEGAKSLCA